MYRGTERKIDTTYYGPISGGCGVSVRISAASRINAISLALLAVVESPHAEILPTKCVEELQPDIVQTYSRSDYT